MNGVFQSSGSSESDKKGDVLSNGSIKEQSHCAPDESNDQATVKQDIEMTNKPFKTDQISLQTPRSNVNASELQLGFFEDLSVVH